MRGIFSSVRKKGVPELGWPEKVDRVLVTIAVVVLLVGTPFASMLILSKHVEEQTITIAPDSYYAVHFGTYGYGGFDYSYSVLEGDSGYLLRLDRLNFWLFKSGYDYDSMRANHLGGGSGGGGGGGGLFWETYYVFVNDGRYAMQIKVEFDSTAYFSFPIALLLLGVVAIAGYAYMKRAGRLGTVECEIPSAERTRSERRKAVIAIAEIILLTAAMVTGIGLLLPSDLGQLFTGMIMFSRLWLSSIVGIIIVFKFRHKLRVVKGEPGAVLAQLTHRLRISGYMVSEKQGVLTVRISTTSAIRISAKPVADGTIIRYRAAATPKGLSIVVFLLIAPFSAILGLALSLFMLYRSAVFVNDRIIPRLHQLQTAKDLDAHADTREMLIDSLSEGRRLSAEAYEAARSNYHDSIILLVIVGLVSSLAIFTLSYGYVFQDLDAKIGLIASLLSGVIVGITFALIPWRILGRRSRPRVDELEHWTAKLERALHREVAVEHIPDDESSSFELVLESCKEVPEWLRTRRKARMFRDPVSWILIFLLSLMAFEFAAVGISSLVHDHLSYSAWYFGLSAGMGFLAAFVYLRWKRRQVKDDEGLMEDMKGRFQDLKKEMETYLGGV
ncbi:MAG: hypothetical protein MUO87_08330 [Thermoplasmata archaeon]|nr:hypothetical protein [Thermoplasmata archaeon]